MKRVSFKGFSLVEVVVLAGVLSFGLLSLVYLFPLGFQAKERAENFSLVSFLAQTLMEKIKAQGYDNLEIFYPRGEEGYGKGEGSFENYPRYRYEVRWWDTQTPGLRKLKIKIIYPTNKGPQFFELTSFLAQYER